MQMHARGHALRRIAFVLLCNCGCTQLRAWPCCLQLSTCTTTLSQHGMITPPALVIAHRPRS